MFCPRCGTTQSEELKFCKSCGANLYAVRQVVDTRETIEKTDPNKPWFAEMTLADAKSKRIKDELDHQRGIAPLITRSREIKAGVITSSVGLALMISLFEFMQGIINSGAVSHTAADIIARIWIFGLIPLLIGFGLIINGVFVSKRLAEMVKQIVPNTPDSPEKDTNRLTSNSEPTEFLSVTEGTTTSLGNLQKK